jgi:hypothetical protein
VRLSVTTTASELIVGPSAAGRTDPDDFAAVSYLLSSFTAESTTVYFDTGRSGAKDPASAVDTSTGFRWNFANGALPIPSLEPGMSLYAVAAANITLDALASGERR